MFKAFKTWLLVPIVGTLLALSLVSCGGNSTTSTTRTFTGANQGYSTDDLYRFFAVAFGAAPGVTYMGQLIEAAEWGLSIKEIVNIFTTKSQFTDTYPLSMSNADFATKLVNNVVGASANDSAKQEAINDIVSALSLPNWTRGDVIYAVFNNLASKPESDTKWYGTAKKMANQVVYAKYYTENLNGESVNLRTLQAVISNIDQSSYVSGNLGLTIRLATSQIEPPIAVQKTSYLNAKNLNIPSQKIPAFPITDSYREDAFGGVAFGDFLQEGKLSLVTFTNINWTDRTKPWVAGSVYFFQYVNGEPVDVTSKLLKDTTGCIAPRRLLVADFNNDGKPDVFASCHGSEENPDWRKWTGENPRILLSQSDGTYKNVALDLKCYCHGSTAGDIDGDGNIDLITSDFNRPYIGKSSLILLKGDGKGNFTEVSDSSFVSSVADGINGFISYFNLELIDFNNDGELDLYLGNGDWYPSYIIAGDGKGNFNKIIKKFDVSTTPGTLHYHFNDIVFSNGYIYLMANKNWDRYKNEVRKYNLTDDTYSIIFESPTQDFEWFNNFIFMMPYKNLLVPYNSIFNIKINF